MKINSKRLVLLLLIAIGLVNNSYASEKSNRYRKKYYPYQLKDKYSYDFGIYTSYSAYSKNIQEPFKTDSNPISLGIEIYRKKAAWSVGFETEFMSEYSAYNYNMKPLHFRLFYKHYILKQLGFSGRFDTYIQLGLGSYSVKLDNKITNEKAEMITKERKSGFDGFIASGIVFRLNNISISSGIKYSMSEAKFNAGYESGVKMYVGSLQANIAIAYNFKFKKQRYKNLTRYR
ncbi:MAG: hypothetical protein N4A49_13200 [Marinifilaceae bacterium]|jgi:hypothetical protein|nr:hypothetical protein [Marinifilaceae bacterium]